MFNRNLKRKHVQFAWDSITSGFHCTSEPITTTAAIIIIIIIKSWGGPVSLMSDYGVDNQGI
jgi:hypothetical protein